MPALKPSVLLPKTPKPRSNIIYYDEGIRR